MGSSDADLEPEHDEGWVMISALAHWCYCPRRCALIHLEQVWDENVFTMRGRREHERVDEETSRTIGGVLVHYALPLVSEFLGIYGKADAVEFHPGGSVFPVEYKHGKKQGRKKHDLTQLCAQAMCLEEMLDRDVSRGALFYRQAQARLEVDFTPELRQTTQQVIQQVRDMLRSGITPLPANDKRCPRCSLLEACQPELVCALARFEPESLHGF